MGERFVCFEKSEDWVTNCYFPTCQMRAVRFFFPQTFLFLQVGGETPRPRRGRSRGRVRGEALRASESQGPPSRRRCSTGPTSVLAAVSKKIQSIFSYITLRIGSPAPYLQDLLCSAGCFFMSISEQASIAFRKYWTLPCKRSDVPHSALNLVNSAAQSSSSVWVDKFSA